MNIRDTGRLVDVVVVVPARDESARISACLQSVRASLVRAVAVGVAGKIGVAVVGHSCSDDTLGRAERELTGIAHVLLTDSESSTVGEVRALGVQAALDLLPSRAGQPGGVRPRPAPREVWILNTDADSIVPVTWILDVLAHAKGGEQAVIGMAKLLSIPSANAVAQQSGSGARLAYEKIIREGFRGQSHEHVYGANLAVRADAYAAVGGFRAVPIGEDRAMLDSLIADERPIARPRGVVVRTSGRRVGRAAGGLATLLDTLDRAHSHPDQQ